jgi:Zinc finger, C2H2 type
VYFLLRFGLWTSWIRKKSPPVAKRLTRTKPRHRLSAALMTSLTNNLTIGMSMKDLMIITGNGAPTRRSQKKSQQREWACGVPGCNAILYSKSSRFRHQTLHKKPSNQYQCKQCPSSFLIKLDLIDHERHAHCPKDSYVSCEQCERTFSSLSNLQAHKEIHTEARVPPHKCNLCDAAYFHRSALKRHERNEHFSHLGSASDDQTLCSLSPKATHTSLIFCTYCSATCSSEYEFHKHLGSKHYLSTTRQCLINQCKTFIATKESYTLHKLEHYC